MKLLSWNVRGLFKPSKQNEVLNLIRVHDLAIFGVMETRLKVHSLGRIMSTRFREDHEH